MLLAALVVLSVAVPPKGSFATDETGRVSAQTLAAFNATARALDGTGAGQLGLAVVGSTHGENPRTYATRIFNSWGIGHAGRNDGVLLFLALDDRKAEIVVGDGFTNYQSTTDRIMANDVVANLKAKNLDLAITQSAMSLAELVERSFAEPTTPQQQPAAHVPPPTPEVKERSPRSWELDLGWPLPPDQRSALDREGDAVYASGKGLLFYAFFEERFSQDAFSEKVREKLKREDVWIVFANMSNGYVVIRPPDAKRHNLEWNAELTRIENDTRNGFADRRGSYAWDVVNAMTRTGSLITDGLPPKTVGQLFDEHQGAAFGGIGGFGLVGLVSLRSWLRRRPRECKNCGNRRHKLNEETDDPHLNPGQRMEESLGSVDYDVWWCGRCNDALVLRYGAIFTSYKHCEGCGHKTATSSSVTLVHATYDHGGTVEVTERCQNCPHVNTYTRYTSQLTRSSDSSSSYSSSSSSSFGGGSSSGGGSSGSW